MGRLKSVAVNAHAQHCFEGEEEQMPCCKDTSQELKVEEITTVSFDFDANPDLFELAIINHILLRNIDFAIEQEKSSFQNYDPPLPDRDIPVLIQSFLI
ncbi:hypothetical protein [Ekhidna sp.]|uniref:HYC_CC_PP family protein n=1 Tax=Ekhidna sp. TaxID=2608089 RepID=UPI0035179BBE